MTDEWKKPQNTKYTTFLNPWELCRLLAAVLHVSGKPNPWDNHSTFDLIGYMPLRDEKSDLAEDSVKEIIRKAQSKAQIGIFQESSNETYAENAKSFIDKYICLVKDYRQEHPDDDAERDARRICIDQVTSYVGEKYRSRCAEQYDRLFSSTLFQYGDYELLLKKDVKLWNKRDKALLFSIPFCGQAYEVQRKLYGDFFDIVTRCADRLGNNGSKHTNLWIWSTTKSGPALNFFFLVYIMAIIGHCAGSASKV